MLADKFCLQITAGNPVTAARVFPNSEVTDCELQLLKAFPGTFAQPKQTEEFR